METYEKSRGERKPQNTQNTPKGATRSTASVEKIWGKMEGEMEGEMWGWLRPHISLIHQSTDAQHRNPQRRQPRNPQGEARIDAPEPEEVNS